MFKGIFLDIETNGLDFYIHNPLEIGMCIVDLNSNQSIYGYYSFISCSENQYFISSDPNALKINGIKWSDVSNGKPSTEVCEDLSEIFLSLDIHKNNSFFICQNPSFDRGFFDQIMDVETQKELDLPYHWLDLASMYWIKMLSKKSIDSVKSLSKDSIAKSLNLPIEPKPHRAFNGVKHLIDCYEAVSML